MSFLEHECVSILTKCKVMRGCNTGCAVVASSTREVKTDAIDILSPGDEEKNGHCMESSHAASKSLTNFCCVFCKEYKIKI